MAPLSHSPVTLTHLQIVKAVLYSLAPGTLLVQWVSVEDQLENRHVLMAAIPTQRYGSTAFLAPEGPGFSIRKRAFQAVPHTQMTTVLRTWTKGALPSACSDHDERSLD